MNIVFDDGQHIIGNAPEWFFKPIDNIYGDFRYRTREKSDLYLKNIDGVVINLREEMKNLNDFFIMFKIFVFKENENEYRIDIEEKNRNNIDTILEDFQLNKPKKASAKASQNKPLELLSILVIPKVKLLQNLNFKNNEDPIYLRLGKYSANRYVIFFHGNKETNNPGRIPAE